MDWRSMRIVAAAILHDGRVYVLPAPARHHDVMRSMLETHNVKASGASEQGFVTDTGKFVRRKPALIIAEHAKQIIPGRKVSGLCELYSEDVW